MKALAEQINELDGIEIYGRVVGVRGLMVEVAGPIHAMSVGARVVIETTHKPIPCEVVGFSGGNALLMPFAALEGVRRGCRAMVSAVPGSVRPSPGWLGRVLNAMGEPIADAVRAILDGHIVMERAIAERGRYPAINVLKSVSRSMPRSADPAFVPALTRARAVMATYADMEELIRLGAYRPGSSPDVDEAIALHPPLEAFLAQGKEESTSLIEGYQRLEQILAVPTLETEN